MVAFECTPCRPYVPFRRVVTQVVFSRTPVVCAAGLGLSAPRLLWSCGPVGWSLFPLNFLSPGVVCRPSLWLVLWARRNCGCVGWPFFPLHSQSSVVMDRAFVFPFRFGVVEVSSCRAPTICPRSAHPCPSLPDLPSASTRPPAESRTFSLRRVSQRLVLTHHFIQARRLRCRSVHDTDAPLKQLVGLSHENSLARCERSGAQPPSAARRFSLGLSGSSTSAPPAARGLGRGDAGLLACHLPEPKFARSFASEGCTAALARVSSSGASPARQRWLG